MMNMNSHEFEFKKDIYKSFNMFEIKYNMYYKLKMNKKIINNNFSVHIKSMKY